ncbi:MAG: transcription termination factor NusA [Candidatus Aenigmatarchaeota archaeon]
MIDIKSLKSFISQIVEERELSEKEVENIIASALAAAYKKDFRNKEERVEGELDLQKNEIRFYLVKKVVENDAPELGKFNPYREITLSEARKIRNDVAVGDEIKIPLEYKESFSRIAAQPARQVIIQNIKELEKENIYNDYKEKEGGIVTGIIQRVDQKAVYVNLPKATGIMFRTEAIPGEFYRLGSRMRFYVYGIEKTPGGVEVYLSRAHPYFIASIFRFEIPEISEGIIEIKGIARIPGVRSKIAVKSNIEGIDAVGSCIGPRGARVLSISNELNGERIDIIPYSDDPLEYVINAMLPAKILKGEILPRRTVRLYVNEEEIPIALGKNGQNIKLAAKLTGWKIDVRLIGEPEKEIEGGIAEAEENSQKEEVGNNQ